MAMYRNISMSFWTDSNVVDDYIPEDRYFYLYLMTNPHTNLCGCYEISIKQMADELGYSKETVEKLLIRFSEVHKTVCYQKDTKELLLINWSKYNWTASEKFRKPLGKEISNVKDDGFRRFLTGLYESKNTVSVPYPYGSDTTVTVTDTDTDTVTVSDTDTVNSTDNKSESCHGPNPQDSGQEEQAEHDFGLIYAIYPKKVGRTVAFAHYRQWTGKGKNVSGKVYRLTNKQIYMAVKKYARQQEEAGKELEYWKNFDTLMGRQLLDYVDWGDGKE